VSHQRGVAGDYSTVTKLTNVSTVKRAQLLGKLRSGLALTKIPEAAIVAAAEDALGDQKQAVMADENLKCMLKPSQEAIDAAQRPWADNGDGEGVPAWENQGAKATGSATATAASDPPPAAPEEPKELNAKERRAQRRAEEATAAKTPKAVVF
jgi:hypothetical protein